MTGQDMLADAVSAAKDLLGRFLAGFDESNRATQAPGLPNHVSWSLGHMAFYLNHVAEQIDGKQKPDCCFTPAGAGDGDTYDPETIAFGSAPTVDATKYPPLTRGVEIYNAACDRLAAARAIPLHARQAG